MKTSTSDLRALLHGSRSAAFSDLVTITLADDTEVRWTTAGWDLTYDSNTYTAGGTGTVPLIGRGTIREAMGLEVSTLELRLSCGTTAQIGGRSVQSAAQLGFLDDARVTVVRAYHAGPSTTVVGVVSRFSGVVSDCEADSQQVRLRVQSDLYRLNQMLPRNLIREKCSWDLYGDGCNLVKATYTASSTIVASPVSTTSTIYTSHGSAANYYNDGLVTFTSGTAALVGVTRVVFLHLYGAGVATFVLAAPLPVAPSSGDGVSAVAGCDKTYATCSGRFSNTGRFRGFPFVPMPESVTR